jgi:hypothetical protein
VAASIKKQIRKLKTALRWKVPAVQRARPSGDAAQGNRRLRQPAAHARRVTVDGPLSVGIDGRLGLIMRPNSDARIDVLTDNSAVEINQAYLCCGA